MTVEEFSRYAKIWLSIDSNIPAFGAEMGTSSVHLSSVVCLLSGLLLMSCDSTPPAPSAITAPAPTGASPSKIPGPVPGTRMTPEFVTSVGTSAYLWAWPMVNLHNRLVAFSQLPEPGLMGGIVPVAPANQLSMLTDYVVPEERMVACPNQDVVYGFGLCHSTKNLL